MTLIAALSEEQVRQTVEIAYHVLYVRAVISKGHAGAFAAAAYASGYMAVGGAGGTGRQNEGFHGRYQSTQAVNLLFEGADFLVGERGKSGILRFGCDMCGAGHEDSLDITQKGIAFWNLTAQQADVGNELIHVSVCADPHGCLRHSFSPDQGCLAGISGFGVYFHCIVD